MKIGEKFCSEIRKLITPKISPRTLKSYRVYDCLFVEQKENLKHRDK